MALTQYAKQLSKEEMKRLAKQFGLTTEKGARDRLLTEIESMIERVPDHSITSWGTRGWWYHGTLNEDEWVLIRLKFFS